MAWVFLEILAALAVALLIVWWTMPRKPGEKGASRGAEGDER